MMQASDEVPFKKNGKITKYDDSSTKVVYNSTTKYDFVSICLQILLKSAKINQRVTTATKIELNLVVTMI